MSWPSDDKCRPRIALHDGKWYATAPNRSPMAMALLVPAINFVRHMNRFKPFRRVKRK